jgi:hypothetical protein
MPIAKIFPIVIRSSFSIAGPDGKWRELKYIVEIERIRGGHRRDGAMAFDILLRSLAVAKAGPLVPANPGGAM